MFTLLAYLDPGTGSLLIQALVGGSAGLMVFARYLWESVGFAKFPAKAAQRESHRV